MQKKSLVIDHNHIIKVSRIILPYINGNTFFAILQYIICCLGSVLCGKDLQAQESATDMAKILLSRLQLDVFCYGIKYMYRKWTMNQYALDPDTATDSLCSIMPEILKHHWYKNPLI